MQPIFRMVSFMYLPHQFFYVSTIQSTNASEELSLYSMAHGWSAALLPLRVSEVPALYGEERIAKFEEIGFLRTESMLSVRQANNGSSW